VTGKQGESARASGLGAPGVGRVLRAAFTVLGRPASLQALALSIALGIPAAIVFSQNGLRASFVVAALHRSLLARLVLWAAWLALSLPALRAVLDAPGSKTLRALRLPRAPLTLALCLLCALGQLPWALLFARGGGALAAWAAVTLAVALGASLVAARVRPRLRWLVALGVALVALDPPSWLGAALASVGAPFGVHAAFRSVLEQPRARFRLLRPMPAIFAVYLTHLLRLVRSARSRLFVAIASGAAGGVGLCYSLGNDPTERPVQRALSALALPLTVAAAACVAPVIESEARLRVLLRSLRVPQALVVLAFLGAIATPSTALAASAGVAARVTSGDPSALVVALIAWALGLSVAVALWGRWLEARARRSAGAFAAGVTLIAGLALVLASSW
jgi:hypothetical protein